MSNHAQVPSTGFTSKTSLWSLDLFSFFLFQFLCYIGVQLIYNVVLVSGVQQSDSVIYIYEIFRFFFHIGYYRLLCSVLSAIQQVLFVYLFNIQLYVYVNLKPLIDPSPSTHTHLSPLVTIGLFSKSTGLLFCKEVSLYHFLGI